MKKVLIVGSGLTGATIANELKKYHSVTIIEKKRHIGGNVRTDYWDKIPVHTYGAHIFNTSDLEIWNYIKKFSKFNNYIHNVQAENGGTLYQLPFNRITMSQMYGYATGDGLWDKMKLDIEHCDNPQNIRDFACSKVGKRIYRKLIKNYTEKQWGKRAERLPPDIIKRIPIRDNMDCNYYNSEYQGIPINGYTPIIENMIDGCILYLNTDFLANRDLENYYDHIVYTGPVDDFFNCKFGPLEWRGVYWKHEKKNISNYQGNSVINNCNRGGHTRTIEHKWFYKDDEIIGTPYTVVSKEYSAGPYDLNFEKAYPIRDEKNIKKFNKYRKMSIQNSKVTFCGRLADYVYVDMAPAIRRALKVSEGILGTLGNKPKK